MHNEALTDTKQKKDEQMKESPSSTQKAEKKEGKP